LDFCVVCPFLSSAFRLLKSDDGENGRVGEARRGIRLVAATRQFVGPGRRVDGLKGGGDRLRNRVKASRSRVRGLRNPDNAAYVERRRIAVVGLDRELRFASIVRWRRK
jgi:hypothetical protein